MLKSWILTLESNVDVKVIDFDVKIQDVDVEMKEFDVKILDFDVTLIILTLFINPLKIAKGK